MTTPSLFLVTSHSLTAAQITDLKATFGIENIVLPSAEVADMARSIPATDSFEHISHLAVQICEEAEKSGCDFLCVMGEPALVTLCYVNRGHLWFIQATTERKSVDTPNADGTVTKTAIFEHVQWRVWG